MPGFVGAARSANVRPISNARSDYIGALRKRARTPVFTVSQNHIEIGSIQGQQFGALKSIRIGRVKYLSA